MSRYRIPDEERDVWVGWDPPLGTFFAQEYSDVPTEDDEELIWWIGDGPKKIPTIALLRSALLVQGIVIPQEIDDKLVADEAAPWEPGPLQRKFGFLGKET